MTPLEAAAHRTNALIYIERALRCLRDAAIQCHNAGTDCDDAFAAINVVSGDVARVANLIPGIQESFHEHERNQHT